MTRPKRRTILRILIQVTACPLTVRDLMESLPCLRQAATNSLKELEANALIKRERLVGRHRAWLYSRLPISYTLAAAPESVPKGVAGVYVRLCVKPQSITDLSNATRTTQYNVRCQLNQLVRAQLIYIQSWAKTKTNGFVKVYAAQSFPGQFPDAPRPRLDSHKQADDWIDPIPRIFSPSPGVLRHHCVG